MNQNSTVEILPFTRQIEGEEVIIGRPEIGAFLAIPVEGLEILDQLAHGSTIEQVQALYQLQYGEALDLDDFLQTLQGKGFIRYPALLIAPDGRSPQAEVHAPRYHFTNVPLSWARFFFCNAALTTYGIVTLLALLIVLWQPTIVPGRSSLYFDKNRTLMVLFLAAFSYSTLFLHEMAHLLAARVVGVNSRMGLGHRLWILVAETDMTGLWALPRHKRYVPLIAGPIFDLVVSSLLVFTVFSARHVPGLLAPIYVHLAGGMLFLCLMRLLWQCFFFVRTDFYYVIATYFNCRNLLGDTEVLLRNLLSRVLPGLSFYWQDQTHIPAKEKKVIRVYAAIWIVGRMIALSMLLFVTLPLMTKYSSALVSTFRAGFATDNYAFVDAAFTFILTFVPLFLGSSLWMRSLVRSRRRPT